jgi:hypothetical protein
MVIRHMPGKKSAHRSASDLSGPGGPAPGDPDDRADAEPPRVRPATRESAPRAPGSGSAPSNPTNAGEPVSRPRHCPTTPRASAGAWPYQPADLLRERRALPPDAGKEAGRPARGDHVPSCKRRRPKARPDKASIPVRDRVRRTRSMPACSATTTASKRFLALIADLSIASSTPRYGELPRELTPDPRTRRPSAWADHQGPARKRLKMQRCPETPVNGVSGHHTCSGGRI